MVVSLAMKSGELHVEPYMDAIFWRDDCGLRSVRCFLFDLSFVSLQEYKSGKRE